MAWPATPLGVRVDLQIGGVWTDVTADALVRAGIAINRGRADEAARADAQTCDLTLKNAAGKYSPRNPASPYFGVLGRNTPLRVGIGTPPAGAGTANQTGTSIVAPTVAAEVAGEQYVVYLAAPGGNLTMPGGFTAGTESDGTLSTYRTATKLISAGATGTATATHSVSATSAAALNLVVPGANWTGALTAKNTSPGIGCTFSVPGIVAGQYLIAACGWSADPDDRMAAISDDDGGSEWFQIGDTGASTGPRIKAFARRVGTAGTMSVTAWGDGGGSIDVHLTVWTTDATDYFPRFHGEVSQWPSKWDLSGNDVYVPVQASGVKRRLAGGAGGATPLRSALTRQLANTANVIAYWPMEDEAGATGFASGLPGGAPMLFAGVPALAAYDGFDCSAPVPTFTAAGSNGAVPTYASTNQFVVGALMQFPASGMFDESTLLTVYCSGTIKKWTVKFDAGSSGFRVEAYDAAGTRVLDSAAGPWTPSLNNSRFFLYLQASPSGANVYWELKRIPIIDTGDGTGNVQVQSSTVSTQTVGAVGGVAVGGAGNLTGDPAFGHVVVGTTSTALFTGDVWAGLGAWRNESATARFLRLCQEESVAGGVPYPTTSEIMGPQRPGALLDLLAECEVADDGVIYEPKGFIGLAFRTRTSKYNQPAELTLSYTGGNISDPFEPTDDDQGIANDVTVTRTNGSSARAELLSGPLSTLPPPFGIGRYDSEINVNVNADSQLADQASWRLHVGTWDEARWPQVRVDLPANDSLAATVAGLDVGDLVSLTDLPAWVPPGPTDLIIEGYTETLGHPIQWDFTGNYSPAGPYRVGVYGLSTSRYSPDSAVILGALTTTATAVSVATGGPLWITTASHPAEFPFDVMVGGEKWAVTAITGATSPQTFTVTRSVNGVVKSHATGTAVALHSPARYAL